MAVRKVINYFDPEHAVMLRQGSPEVSTVNSSVKRLVRHLVDTLGSSTGAALSAPQIGEHQRIFVVSFEDRRGNYLKPNGFINPKILQCGRWELGFDGCLSIPGLVTESTLRPSWLIFEAQTLTRDHVQVRVEGINARYVHHEIDHLNGVLYIDRLNSIEKLTTRNSDDSVAISNLRTLQEHYVRPKFVDELLRTELTD